MDKPKLLFAGTWTAEDEGKEFDAWEYLVSSDLDLLDADRWTSSREKTAVIDEKTGRITIRGKGSTRITAFFGNVKVSGILKVK